MAGRARGRRLRVGEEAATPDTSKWKDHQKRAEADSDVLIDDYRTILTELALLTTVSVLLFGFLLSNVRNFADSTLEEWIFAVDIASSRARRWCSCCRSHVTIPIAAMAAGFVLRKGEL